MGAPRIDIWRRMESKVTPSANGCIDWTGARTRAGYGVIWRNGVNALAHRVAYERARGPIMDGLQLDHKCRNRCCVNPDHLEPVTCKENLLRGDTLNALNASKTHCPRGHPYDEANTYLQKKKSGFLRVCRACKKEKAREKRIRLLRACAVSNLEK